MLVNLNSAKKLMVLLILLYTVSAASAQNKYGNIFGTVNTADGKPAAKATVKLAGTGMITAANEDGAYVVQGIEPGSYQLSVTFIGAGEHQQMVKVIAGETTRVNVTLLATSTQLKEVNVSYNSKVNNKPLTVGKANISGLDLPQSSGIVSSQVIADQQINRLGAAVRNVSGVSLTQTRGGVGETFTARGYSIGIGGSAGSILKNGVLVNTAGFPEASTLASVEILKGSSALLYGNVSGGLVINMVTKKPEFSPGGEVSMRYGSYNDFQPTADIYGTISKTVAYRAIATYEKADSYRDNVKTERFYVNPSLLFNVGKRTTVVVEGDFLRSNLTPDWGIGSLNNGRIIPTMVPRSQFINTSWAYSHMDQYSGSVTMDHRFNDAWKLNFISSAQQTSTASYGSSLPNTVSANGDWNRGLARANTYEADYTAQANLTGRGKLLGVLHQLLFGMDVTRIKMLTNAYSINGQNISSYKYDYINIIDLHKFIQRTDIPITVDTARTEAPVNRFGTYLQDLVTLTDKLKVLAGIRWSWQQTYQTSIYNPQTQVLRAGAAATRYDQALSPKVSLIYQPFTCTSFYGSYSNSFIVNSGTDVHTGQGLKPSVINQYEAGAKKELLAGKLSLNFSVYRIINNNLAVVSPYKADGITVNSDNTVKTFTGQTTSDGADMDITGNITNNFYFIAGYAFNFARYTKTSGLKGSNILGEQLVINPRNTMNFTSFYTFTNPLLRNFKVGASAFYTGRRLAGYNNTVGQVQNYSRLLPVRGFATADVSAGYTYNQLSLLVQLSNVTNTLNYLIHDNYSVTPIAPRQLLATLNYKFK